MHEGSGENEAQAPESSPGAVTPHVLSDRGTELWQHVGRAVCQGRSLDAQSPGFFAGA